MNRIVLIGNGFDLAHNLKTSYVDFISNYWRNFINEAIRQTEDFEIKGIKVYTSNSDITLRKTFEHDIPQTYKVFEEKITEYNQNMRRFNAAISINIKNKFLKHLLTENSFKNWVDIENEYYNFLCYQFNPQNNSYSYANIGTLNEDFKYIKEQLELYLTEILKESIHKHSKIEHLIYDSFYLNEVTEKFKQEVCQLEAEKIDKLKQHLPLDEDKFEKTKRLLENFPDINEALLKSKLNNQRFWENYFDLKPNDFLFLNFNYTDTINHYCQFIHNDRPLLIDIHGELNNSENPMIFGYGDELEENYSKLENLQDNEYLENIKSIKYQETDNYKQVLSFINSDKYQVIILGHSCGNSDRTLLNTLFEHENCVSIKPYYYKYQDKKTGEIKDNYSDMVRNISRSFTDKKSMRDKVVNKTYTDWFSTDF